MKFLHSALIASAMAMAGLSGSAWGADYHNPDGTPVGGAHYNPDGTPVQGLEEPGETIDNNFLQHTIGNQRSYENKALDPNQRPALMLLFAGLRPNMNMIEILPANRYWAEYLGVYLTSPRSKGKFTQAADRSNAALWASLANDQKLIEDAYESHVDLVSIDSDSFTAPGTADIVLMSKKLGELMAKGKLDKVVAAAYASLKPEGRLLVEDYRAGAEPAKGYIREDDAIAAIEKAGFKFARKDDTLYANAADTRTAPAPNSDRFLLLFTK